MARQRTQKLIAARIDRTYIAKPHPWRKLRRSSVFAAVGLSILLLALATLGDKDKGQWIHNPGRLTFSHASFQNDCAKCHDGCDSQGRPTNRFSLAVSDTACLKCHDSGVHNANQATQVMLDKTRNPPELRSADCASCHTEHRGQSALISQSDLQCVSCHGDLAGKTIKPPKTSARAVDFSISGHPRFGQSLMKDGKLFDPTVLRFNHQKHLTDALKGEQRNCTFCHDPQSAAAQSMTWEDGKNAFSMPGEGPSTRPAPEPLSDGSSRHRSLTQVSYAKNCGICHSLGTLCFSDLAIPHASMSEVRRVVLAYVNEAGAPWGKYVPYGNSSAKPMNDRLVAKSAPDMSDHSAILDAVTAAVKDSPLAEAGTLPPAKLSDALLAKLTSGAVKIPASLLPEEQRPALLSAIAATTQPSTINPAVLARLRDEVGRGLSGSAKTKLLKEFDANFMRYDPPDPRLIQLSVFYANPEGTSCILCHDASGEQYATAIPAEWSALAPAGGALSPNDPKVFATAPTGIPAGPRRWFTGAEFNHDAHRSMNCVECHAAALTSEKTSDVLSPDIEWQGLKFDPSGSGKMIPAVRSCVECHHPDNSDGPGAASNCTECHMYHDRSHERPTTSTPDDVLSGKVVPSTQPVAPAGSVTAAF